MIGHHRGIEWLLGALLLTVGASHRLRGATLNLLVEPAQSGLAVAGAYLELPLQPQDAAGTSGRSTVRGTVSVDIDDLVNPTTLKLMSVDWVVDHQGAWLPEPGGGTTPGAVGTAAPANFALWVDAGELGRGYGAIRDLTIHVEPETLTVTNQSFVAPSQLYFASGTFDYNVDTVIEGISGQSSIVANAENQPDALGQWQLTDDGASLVIPIQNSTLTELNLSLTGQIVSSIPLPWRRGDFDGDSKLSLADVNALMAALRTSPIDGRFDLNLDHRLDELDIATWVESRRHSYVGDANLDGEFDGSDLIAIFIAGQYEDDVPLNATWETGDWTGDAEFLSDDLVFALQAGGYEQGVRQALAVPEPTHAVLLSALWLFVTLLQRSSCRSLAHECP